MFSSRSKVGYCVFYRYSLDYLLSGVGCSLHGQNLIHQQVSTCTNICLRDILHVPELGANLIAFDKQAQEGGGYSADEKRALPCVSMMRAKYSLCQNLAVAQAYSSIASAYAVIAPGRADTRTLTDCLEYHCSNFHVHDALLEILAKKQGSRSLRGRSKSCLGCSLGKAIQASVQKRPPAREQ